VRAIIWQAGFSREVTHLAFAGDPALGERNMIDWTATSPPMSNIFSIASISSAIPEIIGFCVKENEMAMRRHFEISDWLTRHADVSSSKVYVFENVVKACC